MPIRTSLLTPSTPDPRPAVPTMTWTSPDGETVITMNDFGGNDWGIQVMPGVVGLGMPEFTYYETASPSFDGTTVRGVRANSRDISLPLLLWGANRAQCLENYHGLISAMNPRNGAGTLTVTQDGVSRSISAYYEAGLQGAENDDETGMTYMSVVIVLKCPSPYFLGDPVVQTLRIAYGDTFFPLLPVQLVADRVLGSTTITNDGDAEAFPVYTINGPTFNPSITNATNGTLLSFATTTLVSGDSLVIDTREGVKTVLKNGVNWFANLGLGATLAPLQPGDNAMTFNLPSATIDSSVTISLQKRYLTAF